MNGFEYRVLQVWPLVQGDMEETLNILGKDGWELTLATEKFLYLKRRLPSNEDELSLY